MTEYPFKILGLSGEYRPTSKCGMLVNHALDIAKSHGAEVHFWDLDVKPLPLVGEDGCWDNSCQRIPRSCISMRCFFVIVALNIMERCQVR